jgi:hypothetical protein
MTFKTTTVYACRSDAPHTLPNITAARFLRGSSCEFDVAVAPLNFRYSTQSKLRVTAFFQK